MVAEVKDMSDNNNNIVETDENQIDAENEVKELQPSFFLKEDIFDGILDKCNSNGSSPLSSKFSKIIEKGNMIDTVDTKPLEGHELKHPQTRKWSFRASSDFRRKSSEPFLQLHKDSLFINVDETSNAKMPGGGVSTTSSTPTTPVLSMSANAHSPV